MEDSKPRLITLITAGLLALATLIILISSAERERTLMFADTVEDSSGLVTAVSDAYCHHTGAKFCDAYCYPCSSLSGTPPDCICGNPTG